MGLKRTTAPTLKVVTTAEAKRQLSISASETGFDSDIAGYVTAATTEIERATDRAFLTQTYTLTIDEWPACTSHNPKRRILLPHPPLQSVTSIYYINSDGDSTLLSSSLYRVSTNNHPGFIEPAYGEVWPDALDVSEAITVIYVCGETAATSVEADVKHAIKMRVTEFFENRGEDEMPDSNRNLVGSLKTGMHSGAYGVTK